MADSVPTIQSGTIVLVGSFNPAIVQPFWLSRLDLIRPDEAESADVQVISPQVTSFSLAWVTIQVRQEKFIAECTNAAYFPHLLSLVSGIFSYLEHTPSAYLGLIWRAHYELPSEDEWHALGDRIAPKDLWRDVVSSPVREGTPGLRSLTIEGLRSRSTAQWTRIKVEPSVKVTHGLFVEVHDQYKAEGEGETVVASHLDVLSDQWADFLEDTATMARKILNWKGK